MKTYGLKAADLKPSEFKGLTGTDPRKLALPEANDRYTGV